MRSRSVSMCAGVMLAGLLGCVACAVAISAGRAEAAPPTPPPVACGHGGNLAAAISVAAPGSTIKVAGVCHGNFVISKNLTLQGVANPTLDGDKHGAVVIVHSATVTIANLRITDGTGWLAPGALHPSLGGGLYNDDGSVTLSGVTVDSNEADSGGGIENDGSHGGSATMTLVSSTVSNNTGYGGGGISNDGYAGGSASLTLVSSSVIGNIHAVTGGGISNDYGSVTLTQASAVTKNNAGYGGGVDSECGILSVLSGSYVRGNTAQLFPNVISECN